MDLGAVNIGILGSGEVARALGLGFAAHGHDVKVGTRDPAFELLRKRLRARLTETRQSAG